MHAYLGLRAVKLADRSALPSPGCTYLVNPGSVGQPRDGDPRAAFALWDRSTGRIGLERVPYRIDVTLRDIARAGLPREVATRLQQGI
jgi:diadenosine tetraphosphatase ApaH/serine/threonine PP2A family protein phosphatase